MSDHHSNLTEALHKLENQLRTLQLWESETPPADALASTQPFAVDTLTFPQWLQFIFIPRLHPIAEQRAPFPGNCSVAPMAEHYFKRLPLDSVELIAHLRDIDRLLSGH